MKDVEVAGTHKIRAANQCEVDYAKLIIAKGERRGPQRNYGASPYQINDDNANGMHDFLLAACLMSFALCLMPLVIFHNGFNDMAQVIPIAVLGCPVYQDKKCCQI